jgi:hypothetical protein
MTVAKNAASKVFGVDVGTMFFQVAEPDPANKDNTLFKTTRNAFVEMNDSDDQEETLKSNNWQYIKDGKTFYVIGEDAMKVANMFPTVELRRPLASGVLNQGEEKKMLVLTELVKRSIGRAPSPDSVVCTCVSSPSADESPDSAFHRSRLQGIFASLGWHVKVIDEAYAVILSEKPTATFEGVEVPYSGIGVSFGAGRVNMVMAWQGKQIDGLGMSCARSGDWVDNRVAEATGDPLSQITRTKEKKLDFTNPDPDDDRVGALIVYYQEMIRYDFNRFAAKIRAMPKKPNFEAPLEIVVAGGTSMPKGFCQMLEEEVGGLDLPFEIKGVRHASDPRNAVVKGCLLQALVTQKKLQQDKDKALEESLG